MAFVSEVERPPLFDPKKATSEIGPGQYLPLTLYKFEKPNPVPFGASAKRGALFKLNESPGPGAYNPKEDQNISYQYKQNIYDDIYYNKNINKNKSFQGIKNKIKIVHKKSQGTQKYGNKENYGFFTKVERFNEKSKSNTPGPGTYDDKNILLAKLIEEKCYNNKEIIYKINKGRHNVYSVNRFDRQFPWNSEVISLKKSKNKKMKKNKSLETKNNFKSFKNLKQDTKQDNSITISKLKKEVKTKVDSNSYINNLNNNYSGSNIINNEEKKERKTIIKSKKYKSEKFKDKNLVTFNTNEKISGNSKFSNSSEDKSKTKIDDNKYKLSAYKKISSLKKSKTSTDFFIQESNFNKINKNLTKKEIKEKLNQEMKFGKLPNEMKYRISSIPSKFSAGYEIEKESGKVVRKQIKTYFKIFSGEKNDAVGPGSYEINLADDWRKTGTSWSKYLVKKDSLKLRPKSGVSNNGDNRNIINYNKLDKHFKKIVKNGGGIIDDSFHKYNLNIPNLYKLYSTQHIFFHPKTYNIPKMNEDMEKNKMPVFIPVNDVPGPGYYYDEEKINQNFKSGKNDLAKLKNAHLYDDDIQIDNNFDEGGLGPGTYFNDILDLNNKNSKKRKAVLSGKKTKNIPFLCTSKRFEYESPINESYNFTKKDEQFLKEFKNLVSNNDVSVESSNTSNSTHKLGFSFKDKFFADYENSSMSKTYSSKIYKFNKFKPLNGTFYRRDMRFRETFQEENRKKDIPGPGSYINPYTNTGKTNSVKVDGRYMDIRSCRVLIEKNRANKFDKNKKIDKNIIPFLGDKGSGQGIAPPVGTYEPDKTLTILYDINRHKKYGNNHFNSTQFSDRNGFYLFQRNAPNGPGCYYHDKSVEKKQISAAFNSTSDRFFIGGKNNTRNLHEVPKKKMDVSVKKNKDGESTVGLTEKVVKEREIEQRSILSNSSTPNIVGPGSYNFLREVYPWVKQSYNTKFI